MWPRRILPVILFLLFALSSTALAQTPTPKEVAREYYKTVVNERDFEQLPSFIHSHFKDQHASRWVDETGRAGIQAELESLAEAFPDYRVTVQEVIVQGESVVVRLTFMGTHNGTFMDIAPTGSKVVMRGVEILRVREGQITERFGNYDINGLKDQLKADEADPTS